MENRLPHKDVEIIDLTDSDEESTDLPPTSRSSTSLEVLPQRPKPSPFKNISPWAPWAVKSVEASSLTLLSTAAGGPGERKRGDHDESSNELPSPRKILGARPLEVSGDGDSSDEEFSDEASSPSPTSRSLNTSNPCTTPLAPLL